MKEIESLLLKSVVTNTPLGHHERDALKELGPIGLACLIRGMDAALLEEWYDLGPVVTSSLERFAYTCVDRDEVVDDLDRRLAKGERKVAADIFRTGLTWQHESLVDFLVEDADIASASLLVESDPEVAISILDELNDRSFLVLMRAAGILGAEVFYNSGLARRSQLAEKDHVRLDAALANMSRERFSRHLLAGEVDDHWLGVPELVVDMTMFQGFNSWLETVILLDACKDEAFSLAARFCVAAHVLDEDELDEDEAEAYYEILAGGESEQLGVLRHPQLIFAQLLGGEDELLQKLLVHAAIHEILTVADFDSPGIFAFPLSANYLMDDEYEATAELLSLVAGESAPDEFLTLMAVKTLVDLASRAFLVPEEGSDYIGLVRPLMVHPRPSISAAATYVAVTMGERLRVASHSFGPILSALIHGYDFPTPEVYDVLANHARGEDFVAVGCMMRLVNSVDASTFDTLSDIWTQGPLARAYLHEQMIDNFLLALFHDMEESSSG